MTKDFRWWTGMAGIAFVILIVPGVVTEILGPISSQPRPLRSQQVSYRPDRHTDFQCVLRSQLLSALLVFMIGVTKIVRKLRA